MMNSAVAFEAPKPYDLHGLFAEARPPLVLVADQDAAIRDDLCDQLERDRFRVLPATDGEAAMDYIDLAHTDPLLAELPCLLITDFRMPGRGGLDLVCYAQLVPTIVTSGFATPRLRAEALRLGARTVLAKPLDWQELRAIARTLVDEPT